MDEFEETIHHLNQFNQGTNKDVMFVFPFVWCRIYFKPVPNIDHYCYALVAKKIMIDHIIRPIK